MPQKRFISKASEKALGELLIKLREWNDDPAFRKAIKELKAWRSTQIN